MGTASRRSKEPLFSSAYRDDPHASTPASVKAVIGFYGV
jgi:hypothetical protein